MMENNYQVFTARSACTALEEHYTPAPQVIITDYKMPEMDGISFIQKARSLWPEGVFIMITGYLSLALSLEAINTISIFRLLVKPFEEKDLLRAIADAFELYRFRERINNLISRDNGEEKCTLLERVVAETSHELKNQFTIIGLTSELAIANLNHHDLDKVLRNLQSIQGGIEKMAHLLKGLRKLSSPAEKHPTDLNQLIQETISFLEPLNHFDRIKFSFKPGKPLPPLVINPMQINQVLINLYLNAAEAMGEGTITTQIEPDPSTTAVLISIEDSGSGIPLDMRARIFEPNFTTKKEGTGMGLYISKRIVEEHGGSLTLRNGSTRGACFVIEFPINRR